ncbi:fibronectin type III domain-containing protein [Kribbella sp.]|uniref:fibronectin type III domain-containing protein n=1 Tax=Kribbella sp. TaxID=1871183 RepID=UPI002D40ACA7|nr:fibronectin type III domain-containing protein [Kribbella sp.]HZX07953.1 fibronectin type III domain-containing protein [Kribbella sp.]
MTRLASAIRRPVAWWTIAALVLGTFIGYSALGRGAPAVAFQQAGHWVYNATLGAVFRVDGGGKNVDAEVRGVQAEAGSQVVQGATNGYVVRSDGVIVFGKSNLTVKNSVRIGIPEEPIGIEAQSGPYLVYRQHGQIVRLGDQLQTITVGSVVSSAIASADGALWVRDADHFCKLAPAATTLACQLPAQGSDAGALLSVAGKPAFANLSKRTLTPLSGDKAGHAVPLDVTGALPTTSVVAQSDVNGRIPILAGQRLLLVDAAGAKAAESINLPPGRYDAVAAAGASVAVVDADKHVVRTFAPDGKPLHTHELGKQKGKPRVTAGQDGRLYIDDQTGQVVTVVDGDGSVSDVDVNGGDKPVSPTASQTPTPTSTPTTPTPSSTPTSTPSTPTTPTHRPILPPVQVTIGRPHPTETLLPPHPTEHKPTKTQTTKPTPPPTTRPTPPPTTKPTVKPTKKPTVPPASAPGAPGSVTAKPGSGKATVTWTAARANGAAISAYKVSFRVAPGTYVVGLPASGSATVSGSARSHSVSQLLTGGGYIFTVQAINRVGSGPAVDSKVISINGKADPPGPPTKVGAAANPDGSVTVSWTSPSASDYTMTGYTVIGSDGTKTQVPTYLTSTTLNPAKGKAVSYQVTATNSAGTSVRSAASRTIYPYGPAAAPKVTATPGKGSLTVKWTAPNLNGGQLVHYVVSATGQADRTVTTTSTRYTGLTALQLTVSVTAITRERNNSSSATATGTAGSTTATPAAGAPALPPVSPPAGVVRRTARRRKDR